MEDSRESVSFSNLAAELVLKFKQKRKRKQLNHCSLPIKIYTTDIIMHQAWFEKSQIFIKEEILVQNFQAGSRSENLFLNILLIAAIRKKLSIAKLIMAISTPLCFQILSEYPMVAHFQRAQLETLSVQQDRWPVLQDLLLHPGHAPDWPAPLLHPSFSIRWFCSSSGPASLQALLWK